MSHGMIGFRLRMIMILTFLHNHDFIKSWSSFLRYRSLWSIHHPFWPLTWRKVKIVITLFFWQWWHDREEKGQCKTMWKMITALLVTMSTIFHDLLSTRKVYQTSAYRSRWSPPLSSSPSSRPPLIITFFFCFSVLHLFLTYSRDESWERKKKESMNNGRGWERTKSLGEKLKEAQWGQQQKMKTTN